MSAASGGPEAASGWYLACMAGCGHDAESTAAFGQLKNKGGDG